MVKVSRILVANWNDKAYTRAVVNWGSISQHMGIGKKVAGDPGSEGAGDISFIAKYVDCIDGLGSPGRIAHGAGETTNLKQFPYLIQRAAILIYRLMPS